MRINSGFQRKHILLGLALLAQGYMLIVSRHAYLDDAFIHLRFAEHLATGRGFSYNDHQTDFGSSSPLYVCLLSVLVRAFGDVPFLPKLLSVFFLLLTQAILVIEAMKCPASRDLNPWEALFLLTTLPVALRWLTDGMETSLILFSALTLVLALFWEEGKSQNVWAWFLRCAVGTIACFLRIEDLFLVVAAILFLAMDRGWNGRWRMSAFPLLAGALAAESILVIIFGHLLPDTSVAKAHSGTWLESCSSLVRVNLAAPSLGLGCLGLWLSLAFLQRKSRMWMVNLGMPLFFVLVVASGQAIQGVRYFVGLYFLFITANLAVKVPEWKLGLRWAAILWLAVFCFEAVLVHKVFEGRSESYRLFCERNWSPIHGQNLLAYDVGMIGYFSQATIEDAHGLVNGRETASLPPGQRERRAAMASYRYAFLNSEQLLRINALVPVKKFTRISGDFPFPNVAGNWDWHALYEVDIVHP